MSFAITPQALTALLSTVQAGKMSHEALFNLMKRGDLHEADLTFEEEQDRIDEAPAIPGPLAPGTAIDPLTGKPKPVAAKPAPKPA